VNERATEFPHIYSRESSRAKDLKNIKFALSPVPKSKSTVRNKIFTDTNVSL